MIMKMPVRVFLVLLCAAIIAMMPFAISSPNMLNDIKMELMNDGEDEIDFGRLIFNSAMAEDELEEETLDEGEFASHPEWALPLDFTPGCEPKAEQYTENRYEDESIRVKTEHQEMDDGTKIHIAYVQIADPSQLRTGVVNPEKLGSSKTASVSALAKKYNAVIAINGDNYVDKPEKTTFEYRMTNKIRSKTNRTKDILVIDDQGDFHLFPKSQGIKEFPNELKKMDRKLVNAFTFGPALVIDGELMEIDENYGYNPHGREPRAAIGQMGPLSYVLVVVEAKDRSGSSGFSQTKLGEFMHELGCKQAFNLDGGNSAEMVFGDQVIKGMAGGDERGLSDIIYFASAEQ
jgi:exopolysaccharide biosynthesis protein